jgi:hypothetical protein
MVTKREVLELIADRSRDGKDTSFRSLVRDLDLSEEAACSHLRRLWRERLIRSPGRRFGYRFQLELGESLRELSFRIRQRGLDRIERWKTKDKEKEEESLW